MTIPLRLFLWFWSALWTMGLPLVLGYLAFRSRRDPAYRGNIAERLGLYPTTLHGAIWIHAVSLGELRSAVPLIQQFLAKGDKVVTTHFTPSGRAEAQRVFAPEIASGQMQVVWVPIETAWAFRGFFHSFRPVFGLVMEIEIWPRMVFAAKAASVPLFMCNAQYPKDSFARDSHGFRLRQQIMRGFAGAFVKSDLQAQRFGQIGVSNIAVTGELRFEQPVPAELVAAGEAARQWIGASTRRVICIASAIEGEDAIYVQAIHALRAHHAEQGLEMPLFVYVPRRPERFNEVADFLTAEGLSMLRRSSFHGTFGPCGKVTCPDIFLGDSLGEMYGYLAMCDEVIVGGGFNPKGAHNISEALVMHKPVVTGPYTQTIEYPFAEAAAARVARSVANATELAAYLIGTDGANIADIGATRKEIQDFVVAHSGAVVRTVAAIDAACAAIVKRHSTRSETSI